MSDMRVAGIDWATEPKNRAMVVINYRDDNLVVERIVSPLDDLSVQEACTSQEYVVVAVDIPFGWPSEFAGFVQEWSPIQPCCEEVPQSLPFRYRQTELVVNGTLNKWPLSVSSDRIALGARLWCHLMMTGGLIERVDVLGNVHEDTPTIIEVYPAATLWAFRQHNLTDEDHIKRYKKSIAIRKQLVQSLKRAFQIGMGQGVDETQIVSPRVRKNGETREDDSDKTDAFICALTALVYAGRISEWAVRTPQTDQESQAAKAEGWIFFPEAEGE
jgi:predicted nuclease with RNAse H fold